MWRSASMYQLIAAGVCSKWSALVVNYGWIFWISHHSNIQLLQITVIETAKAIFISTFCNTSGVMTWHDFLTLCQHCTLICYWADDNGLHGDYTSATRLRKCPVVWHRPGEAQKEAPALAQSPVRKLSSCASSLILFFHFQVIDSKAKQTRPRVLNRERVLSLANT